MSTGKQKGYEIEEKVRRMFHGRRSYDESFDFETTKALWEVKSCRLFIRCVASDGHESMQLGRFLVKRENHERLFRLAKEAKKKARYVFILWIDGQFAIKVLRWEEVHVLKEKTHIRIKDVFGDV